MKVAAAFGTNGAGTTAAVERMLAAQKARSWHEPVTVSTSRGALGSVRTADRFSLVPSRYESPHAHLVVAGVPTSHDSPIADRLRRAIESEWQDAVRSLKGIDGPFAAVMWHELERKLTVVTDILGMQPLFMCRRTGRIDLASEVHALIASGAADEEPDPAGWGAFLIFGHTIADRTLTKGVTRVAPGAVLVYEPDTDRLTATPYWSWPTTASGHAVDDDTIDLLGDEIVGDLRACLAHHPRAVVCLSGGYDSRLILAALDAIGEHPRVLTLSHPDQQDDLDGRLARRVARAFALDVDERAPSADFFSSDAYLDFVAESGLASPSLYLFIAQLASCLRIGVEAIWDGIFPGCALFPVHQHPGGFDAYLRHAAPDHSRLWIAAQQLFRADFIAAMREAFHHVLAAERALYADDESGVSQFVVRNRTRHRIAPNPLQAFSNDVIPLTPGMSRTFWETAAAIPTNAKRDHRLYRRLFERRFPKALSVPAVSAGTIDLLGHRIDGDVLRGRLADIMQRRPRLSAALSRLGLGSTSSFWQPSTHLEACVRALDIDDDKLNRAAVERLRDARPPFDAAHDAQRQLLFYWRMRPQAGRRSAPDPVSRLDTTSVAGVR
jgi:hypothetical protein